MNKAERAEIENRITQLENQKFLLSMKDRWSGDDYAYNTSLSRDLRIEEDKLPENRMKTLQDKLNRLVQKRDFYYEDKKNGVVHLGGDFTTNILDEQIAELTEKIDILQGQYDAAKQEFEDEQKESD